MRCPACPGVHKCLGPTGPQRPGEPLFIAEAPGKTEEEKGVILCGPTGQEVDENYLPMAHRRRNTTTFVNAIRCLPEGNQGKIQWNRTKDRELLRSCVECHLDPLIARLKPSLLVPLGRFACEAVGGGIDLEIEHGIPTWSEKYQAPVFPMYHPALGLHEPKKMLYIRNDWTRLRKYFVGKLDIPEDPYPEPDYAEIIDPDEITATLNPRLPLGLDTESSPGDGGPFCLTYSQEPGVGRLIRADDRASLRAFAAALKRWKSVIFIHNLPYDWPVVEEMGIWMPPTRLIDTMVILHNLGNLPQGLKAVSRREQGMLMDDFEDVVVPYSRERVLDYYRQAASHDWPKPEPSMERGADGGWKTYKPQSMSTKFKRFFTDYAKNPDKDVFEMWTKNWVKEQAQIEAVCGPWPDKDIRHVPFAEALFYACRDADATVRLYRLVSKMRGFIRKFGQEQWVEKARRIA